MTDTVVAVVVTYNPDVPALQSLLRALVPQVQSVVIVDNGSALPAPIRHSAEQVRAHWLGLPKNLGIAAAQNRGILKAKHLGATHVLLSDQDSIPSGDMVEQLRGCLREAEKSSSPTAAVGPVPRDGRGGEAEPLVYSFTTWGPKRRTVPGPGETLSVPFVLASGCLISIAALDKVGPMDEPLFIDHVDLAWGLRAVKAGYQILVCGSASLQHSLGDEVARIPGRARVVHLHSFRRNYYIMRNTVFLQRADFLPLRWKLGYLVWMAKYMGYYLLLAPNRRRRLGSFRRAIMDGIAGRGGAETQ